MVCQCVYLAWLKNSRMMESQSMLCGLKQVSDDNSDYDFDFTVVTKMIPGSSYFSVGEGGNQYQVMLLL